MSNIMFLWGDLSQRGGCDYWCYWLRQ